MKVRTLIVRKHEDGLRLSAFIKSKISPEFSGKRIQEAVHEGMCRINGKLERFSSYRVCVGDRIQIDLDKLVEMRIDDSTHTILFEDEYFICIAKPPRVECSERSFPGALLVHRLDKDTSGCLLIAKSKGAQKQLERLFSEKKIAKVYVAIVYGSPKKEQWSCETLLGPKQVFDGQTVYGSTSDGKSAHTLFQKMKQYKKYALVKCVPITGRTHQIRVHLYEGGTPIVGDLLYAKEFPIPKGVTRQLLHAYSLRFTHPVTGVELTLVAPLPPDYNNFVKTLVE